MHESFRLEQEHDQVEKTLLSAESEMRATAKKDLTNTVKLATMRKEVERQRLVLREISEAREDLVK